MTNIQSVAEPFIDDVADSLRVNVSESGATVTAINIQGEQTLQDNDSWWYACRIGNVMGKTLDINVECPSHYQSFNNSYVQLWESKSLDSDAHKANTNQNVANKDQFTSPANSFTDGSLYLSHYPLWPYRRTMRMLRKWALHPQVSPTPSGDEGYVIGTQPAIIDTIDGRSIPTLDAVAFKITGTASDRNKASLSFGVHAGETLAMWSLYGMLNYILYSDDAEAIGLRQYFDFFVYPTIDPQQQWAGYIRSTPENIGATVMNRNWSTADIAAYNIHRAAWEIDFAGELLDVAIDHHNFHGINNSPFYFMNSEAQDLNDAISARLSYKDFGSPTVSDPPGDNLRLFLTTNYLKENRPGMTLESDHRTPSLSNLISIGVAQAQGLWDRTVAGDFSHGPNN